jgi:hypothetical protein
MPRPAAANRFLVARWLELVYWLALAVCAAYATSLDAECSELVWWLHGAQALLWLLLGYRACALPLRPLSQRTLGARRHAALAVAYCLVALLIFVAWPAIGVALWAECISSDDAAHWLLVLAAGSFVGGVGASAALICSGAHSNLTLPLAQSRVSLERFVALPQLEFVGASWAASAPQGVARPVLNEPLCIVCLEQYADGDSIKFLPHCGHHYHGECLQSWLCQHDSCPTCRQQV